MRHPREKRPAAGGRPKRLWLHQVNGACKEVPRKGTGRGYMLGWILKADVVGWVRRRTPGVCLHGLIGLVVKSSV